MAQYFDIIPLPALKPAATTLSTPKSFPGHTLHIKLLGSLGLVIGLVLVGLGLFTKPLVSVPAAAAPPADNAVVAVVPTNETKPSPWRLNIPSIGVDAAIQEVGLTREGNMGVPSNYTDVGWLKQGPRPGQIGNAVITGHLNDGPNVPSVFQNLYKLKAGDLIYVKDKTNNQEQRFRVTTSQSYDVNHAPLDKIFGSIKGQHLNLITCSGTWDKTKKEYSQRLVVFTEIVP